MHEAAREKLAILGYDETFGARPLARVIQEHVKQPPKRGNLFGKLENGGLAVVDVDGDSLVIRTPEKS